MADTAQQNANNVDNSNSQQQTPQEEEALTSAVADQQGFKPGEEIDLEDIQDVPIEVTVVLGEKAITVDELLQLGKGAIVELDKKVGEAVDVFVNNRCVARGEIVIVDDKIGVTMTEIIKNDKD
jgi:flagellar motor switch protein FliN/FliY